MQAIVQDTLRLADVLQLRTSPSPRSRDDEVLVRVHAASIHVGDWILMTGSPFVMRFATGLRKPKNRVPGTDVAGTVEAVGSAVSGLRPGDEVFGWGAGAFAEYVAGPRASSSRSRPASRSSRRRRSASPPRPRSSSCATTARSSPGQKVLINGASGGVGTFAVQIAKALGAEVTGVTSTKNVELVRSIGADHVIDYTREDFTTGGPALRPDPRQRRQPLDGPDPARPDPDRDADLERRRPRRRQARPDRPGDVRLDGRAPAGGPSVKTKNHDDLVALKGLIEAGTRDAGDRPDLPAAETPARSPMSPTGHARGRWSSRSDRPPTSPTDRSITTYRPPKGTHHVQVNRHPALLRQPHRLRRRRRPRHRRRRARDRQRRLRHGRLRHRRHPGQRRSPGSTLGLGVLGGVAIVGGLVAGLVVVDRRPLEHLAAREQGLVRRVLLLLGIFNFGFFAMIGYVIAGPDGTDPSAAGTRALASA